MVLANQTLSKARIRVLELVQELSVFFPAEGVLVWDNKSKGFLLDILNELQVSSDSLSMHSFVDTVLEIKHDVENLPVGTPGEQVAQLAHLKLRLKGLKLELSQAIQGNESVLEKNQLEPVPTPAEQEKPIDDTDIASKLAELKRKYAESLQLRLIEIKELWESLESGGFQEERVLGLLNRFHKLAGNAASFGYQELGKVAANLNARFKKIRDEAVTPDAETTTAISAEIERLFELGDSVTDQDQPNPAGLSSEEIPQEEKPSASKQDQRLLYLVDDDTRLAQFLAIQLEHQGYQVRLIPDPDDLEAAIQEKRPSLILMDISFPKGESAGIKTINTLRNRQVLTTPVVFLSQKNDLETRMAAARARGEAYFSKPVDVSQLIDTIYSLTKNKQGHGQQLAVLHDSPEKTKKLCKRLESLGTHSQCVETAEQLLNALDQQNPDILVLSSKAGGLSGVDLALMLHQQYQFQNLPVIFLNGSLEQQKQLDQLTNVRNFKEISSDEEFTNLIERISQQQSRIRQQALDAAKTDSLTGLHSRQHFIQMLELLETTTELDNKQFGLLLLKIDNFEEILADHGIDAGDHVIRETADILRKQAGSTDLIARLSDDEFCLVNDFGDEKALLDSATSLKRSIGKHSFSYGNDKLSVEASIGHSQIDKTTDSHVAMSKAMGKLYRSLKNTAQDVSSAENNAAPASPLKEKALKETPDTPPAKTVSETTASSRVDETTREAPSEKIKEASLRFQAVVNLRGGDSKHYRASLAIKTSSGNALSVASYLNDFGNPSMAHPLIHLTMKYAIAAVKNGEKPSPVIFIDLPESCVLDARLAVWIANKLKNENMLKNPFVFLLHENSVLNPTPGLNKYLKGLTAAGCKLGLHSVSSDKAILASSTHGNFKYARLRKKLLSSNNSDGLLSTIQKIAHKQKMEVIAYGVESPEALTHSWSQQLDFVQGNFIHKDDEQMDFEFMKFQ